MTPLRNHIQWLGVIALVLYGAYYPVIYSTYGFTDDYLAITYHKLIGPWNFNTLYTALGRPICSVLTGYAFAPIDTISGLSSLRALAVGWLFLSGAGAFLFLRNLRVSSCPCALAAAVITLNPAAGVFAGWAITFIYPVSIFLSLLGGWLFIQALEKRSWPTIAAGFLCLLSSFFIYQPTALAALVLFTVYYFRPDGETPSRPQIKWIATIGLTSIVMITYYIIYKAYLLLLEPYRIVSERAGIVSDIKGKLAYFVQGPLWESTVWWGYYAPKWAGWSIVGGVLLSMFFLTRRHWKPQGAGGALLLTGLLFATALLAASPILVPQENTHQIRVFYPLMSVLGTIPAMAVGSIVANWHEKLRWALTLIPILALAAFSHFFVREGIVKPHAAEVSTYKTYLHEHLDAAPDIAFIKPPILGPKYLTQLGGFHEYGIYSSWLPWVPRSLINILLWEQFPELGGDHTEVEIIQVYPWQTHAFPGDVLVLDANYIFKGRYSPSYKAYKKNLLKGLVPDSYDDPVYGRTETLNRSWYYAEAFGFFRKGKNNTVTFFNYGEYTIESIDSPHGSIMMISNNGTRLITSAEAFPSVYDEATKRRFDLPPISRPSL